MAQTVLPGTLEMLALKALSLGPEHGFGILQRIQRGSRDVLQIEQGALYPALHRLEANGLIESEWGVSSNRRRAKFYRLTRTGDARLRNDVAQWQELVQAMQHLLSATPGSIEA